MAHLGLLRVLLYWSSVAVAFYASVGAEDSTSTSIPELRPKRSLTNMYVMMKCTTGRNAFYYNNYGCWCGSGGSGTPVDGIDRCCRSHDRCYQNSGCSSWVLKYGPAYDWACRGRNPVCKNAGGSTRFHNRCMRPACNCDRAFALCLKRYRYPRRGKPKCPS